MIPVNATRTQDLCTFFCDIDPNRVHTQIALPVDSGMSDQISSTTATLQSTLALNNITVFTMLFKAFTISRKSGYNTSSVLLAPRKGRFNGGVLRTKSYYKPVSFLIRYGTIKIPLYSKAINTQQRLKFCRFHQQWLHLYLSEMLLIK